MTPILVADLTPTEGGRRPHTDGREYINPLRIIAIHPGAGKWIDRPDGVVPVFGVDYEAPGPHFDVFHNDSLFEQDGRYDEDEDHAPLADPRLAKPAGVRTLMLAGTAEDFAAAVADGEMEYDFAAREAARRQAAERAAQAAEENARHAAEVAEIGALETVQEDRDEDEAYYREHPEEVPIEVEGSEGDDDPPDSDQT